MKSTPEELNKIGYRELLTGNEYSPYFSHSKCERIKKVDNGYDAANMEIEWAFRFSSQTKQIAKVLQKETLKETVDSIQFFLRNHIQYKTQIPHEILSPACAWVSRKEGTDCKSFSVFASSILINLGVKHYFRAVKYPEGTHVYIVIPIDQKNYGLIKSYQFNADYYTIDGAGFNSKERKHELLYDVLINPNRIKYRNILCGLLGLCVVISIYNDATQKPKLLQANIVK